MNDHADFPLRKMLTLLLLALPTLLMGQLDKHTWEDRLILLFAKAETQKDYQQQLHLLQDQSTELSDRDLLLYSIFLEKGIRPDQTPLTSKWHQQIQERYNPNQQDFLFLLIGKDGGVKLKSAEAVPPVQLYTLIDGMPMRRVEMRRKKKH